MPAAKLSIPTEAKSTIAFRPGSPGSDGIDCMTEQVTRRATFGKAKFEARSR
jgi:hypothetical protein